MAKRAVVIQDGEPAEVELYDEISEDEERQAEAGTLFSIQGERFANVQWSIHRYRTRREMMDDPSGDKTEWVADVTGELHGQDLVDQVGGGTFRFYGYVPRPEIPGGGRGGGGSKLAFNRLIRLAGPRRDFNALPEKASPLAATATAESSRLDRLERLVEAIATRPAAASPATSLTDMIQGLVALDTLRGRGEVSPDKEMVQTMLDMMDRGAEWERSRDPVKAGEEGTAQVVLKIAEVAGPILGRMLDGLAARRVRPPRPPAEPAPPPTSAAPPAAPSSATVVEEEDPGAPVVRARMMVLVDELAAAIRDHDDVEDIAETVERVVPVGDLEAILAMPDQIVIDDLVRQASGRYPELDTPAARDYLVKVLAELRRPNDGEGEIPVS